MKKKKSEIKWIDVPIHPLPRHISFVLEDILTELRQIREAVEKTGVYPIPNPSYRYPDDRPLPTNYPPWPQYYSDGTKWEPPARPWHPTGYTLSPGINAPGIMSAPPGEYCVPSGDGLRPKDCYTKKELEDKFGVKK